MLQNFDKLRDLLMYQTIDSIDENTLVLKNGTKLTLYESMAD